MRAKFTRGRWRVVDLVSVAVIGSTFGVVYWAWNQLWLVSTPLFVAYPPTQALLYGVWMLPQVIAALVVRRPGAAVFGSMSAVVISAFLGNVFGLTVLIYGLAQGLAAEIVFAVFGYRVWNRLTAGIATALAAVAGTTLDVTFYFPFWTEAWKQAYVSAGCLSGLVLGTVLAPWIVRRLASAGALDAMPSGRAARLVAGE
ncbi:MAG: ECF transporter S component [Candidatus Nanopelagicales bacterium]|nr:ECF transporter S component [Candidatus Nanopelagicales bacterium]